MPITQSQGRGADTSRLVTTITDIAATAFKISLAVTLLLYGYLLWGLFSGSIANVQGMDKAAQAHALQLIQSLSTWLNLSLLVTIVSAVIVYYEQQALGGILLVIAAFMAFGLQLLINVLFAGDAAHYKSGAASELTLETIHRTALVIGLPGIALLLRQVYLNVHDKIYGQDLTAMTYGKDVEKEDHPKALIGALAKCWQLPFCREGIRKKCPIFHAKTKCWKERVGCMCEENIILLAMSDGKEAPMAGAAAIGKQSGFVAIGDLITSSEQTTRAQIATRPGPNGVRIPTNPHLTMGQKRERCRNCIIYNEHQRKKYQLLSPLATVMVPLFVALNFEPLRAMIGSGMNGLDGLISKVSLTGHSGGVGAKIANEVTGSLSVEVIIIVCLSLVMMTWLLRFVEYCVFKIKI